MRRRPASRPLLVPAACILCAASVVMTVAGLTLALSDGRSLTHGELAAGALNGIAGVLLGAFVVIRAPRHPIGWSFVAIGLTRGLAVLSEAWAVHTLVVDPGSLPAGGLASWLQAWVGVPALAIVPLVVAWFPDGILVGRLGRSAATLSVVALVAVGLVVPAAMYASRGPDLLPGAPVPDSSIAHAGFAVFVVGAVLIVVATGLAVVSLIRRFRHAHGDPRQQIKWFAYGSSAAIVGNAAATASGIGWLRIPGAIAVFASIGIGIYRYRLYDIDRLINRTLVYGIVTACVLGAFATLVVLIALIVGRGSPAVAAVSAFTVALLVRPLRARVQDGVDRTFDRRTHDAVNIVRSAARRIGHEQMDPATIVDTLRAALRDPDLAVAFRSRQLDCLVDPAGCALPWADPSNGDRRIEADGPDGTPLAVVQLRSADEIETRTVLDAATPVLEYGRLQAEVLVQVAEVSEVARLAAAGDAERRRIERDLHDGAEQRLVGLALHLQDARRRAHPPDVAELLQFTVEQLDESVQEIRALVHGIMPPALVAGGLPAALDELAGSTHVAVSYDLAGRLAPAVEATAWFVACEALANARKHAPGRVVAVTAAHAGGQLVVRVTDDGPGGARHDSDGLRHLADRVAANGGRLSIDSPPGEGTTITAELPCGS